MSTPNLTEENLQDVPELGDIITLKSTVFGSLTGKIIYRNEILIRVLSIDASDRAYDFSLAEDGDFVKETGVTECIIHTKREYPHFSLQLGAVAGEQLDFFTIAGQIAIDSGIVSEIIASDEEDAIILIDGRRLDFLFIGAPLPIQVIRVSTPSDGTESEAAAALDPALDPALAAAAAALDQLPDEYDLSLLKGLIPAAMVEEIPTADRTYPEAIQREEMYIDLLKSYSESKQKNPNLLRSIARETELLLALKRGVTVTNEKGEPNLFMKSANTLHDILSNLNTPLSSVVPVLALKRVLYTDAKQEEGEGEEQEQEQEESVLAQVKFRDWLLSELKSLRASQGYLAGQDAGGAAQISKLMYTYLYDVLYNEGSVFVPSDNANPGEEILADQEILRTVLPPNAVLGYSKLPGIKMPIDHTFVGPIATRQHRVISSHKTRNQDVIAPGDPGTATNYLIFPAGVGSAWRPMKFSGSLSEDIRAASVAYILPSIETITNDRRSYNPNGVQVIKGLSAPLSEGEDATTIRISDWLIKNLKTSVHPSDTLSIGSVGINRTLDSIGLRSYEWTEDIAKALWQSLDDSQKLYGHIYDNYSAEIKEFLEKAPKFHSESVIPDDSSLFKKAMEIPELAKVLEKLEASPDIVKAQAVLHSAEGTLARVLYLSSANEKNDYLEKARSVYNAEKRRHSQHLYNVNSELVKYKASPIINTCPHVRDMDILRSVMKNDNPKFLAILQKILSRYQGARTNNWIDCKVCNAHLICIHEVMMLYERLHPGRAPALHKEILLDYGGAAFSGKYVCRFCGIPISEFEYDNHLEYDDEGRPLVGRNVAEKDENTVEDELDIILNISLKKDALTFDNPIQAELYELARVMVQNTGFSFDDKIFKSIVEFTYNYIITNLSSKLQYEKDIAKRKVKPAYESYKATIEIAVTAAYILCLIHTMNPIPDVIYPFMGCQFKRGGYPIETNLETDLGAMEYFVCVIANQNRNTEPWNICLWATETSPEKRKAAVRNWIVNMFQTADLRVLATVARATFTQNLKDILGRASSRDRIPSSFRPTTNPKPALFDSEEMVNPERVIESAVKEELSKIEAVVEKRNYQLATISILNAHASALSSGIINEMSQRSESVCCFSSIQDIRQNGASIFNPPAVEKEIAALRLAETIIQKRDPCYQSNGAHLYVHWSSPEAIVSKPVKPDSSYFKLFMRTCFRGARTGEIHEFGRRSDKYECRHCRFTLEQDPLILMSDLNDEEIFNNNTKRKEGHVSVVQDMARAALSTNGVEVNADKFNELLSVVRYNRLVAPFVEPKAKTSLEIFNGLNHLVVEHIPFLNKRNSDWELLQKIMAANFARTGEPTEETRKIAWAPFVSQCDSLKLAVVHILKKGLVKKNSSLAEEIIISIERITAEPLYQGPNEINKHWVVGLERLAQNFSEMVFGAGTWFGQNVGNAKPIRNYLFNGTRWFGKKISQRHTAKFEAMIHSVLGANTDTNKELSDVTIRGYSTTITHRLATYMGAIMKFWTTDMTGISIFGVSAEEFGYILRWITLASIETLLTIDGPLYTEVPTDSDKMKIQKILLGWTITNFIEAKRQFEIFGLTDGEIQLAILDAREKEKISVIKEIDDEKDPDLRAIAMLQKRLKMGRWAIGTSRNLSSYNAEFQDFLQEQRNRAGIADNGLFPAKGKAEDPLGLDFGNVPQEDAKYNTYAGQDEDEMGGME